MAGTYNFTIEQGATFARTLTWKDGSNSPVDLTGATARMKIKTEEGTVVSLTSGSGITLGGSAGTIALFLSDTATAAMAFDTAKYDLEIVLSNGQVKRLLQGVVTLSVEETT